MSLFTQIRGKKSTNLLEIGVEGEVGVVIHRHPPIDEQIAALPYRVYFENDLRSNDMRVNPAVSTDLDFYVEAQPDFDIYIKSISIQIGDNSTPTLNKFGALSALTNGVQWLYSNQSQGEYTLHDGIKTNLEFIRIGVDTAGIGTGTDAFLADNSGGGSEKSYLPVIDITETFGLPYGLRLKKSTTDRLIFRINDDTSALTTLNAIAYGIRI